MTSRLLALVLFLALSAVAKPAAAQAQQCTGSAPCSQGGAYALCMSEGIALAKQEVGTTPPKEYNTQECYESNSAGALKAYRPRIQWRNQGSGPGWNTYIASREYWYNTAQSCPNGVWSESPSGCAPTQQECLAKPALTGGWTLSNTGTCNGGCFFGPSPNRDTFSAAGKTYTSMGGSMPTGSGCSPTETTKPLPNQDQHCEPLGGGQTACLNTRTKQHCYSASAGRQVCWNPGETGEKPDLNVLQKRNAGTTEIPPSNLNLPSGDTLTKQGQSATTTSTHTVNNVTTTTVTTTTNYVTSSGTNAGSTNQGESNTGDGSGKEGDGDGTASGGQNCDSAPITTGDPVMGMVANQAWATRCAVEAGNAAKVTGDIGNCSQPFSVEGTNANAHQLRAMRAQLCPGGTAPDPSQYSGEAGDPSSMFGEAHEIGADGLDMSGLGFGQSCPSIPTVSVMGRTIAFDTSVFCDWMQLGGVFVRIVAALWCLRVIGGA